MESIEQNKTWTLTELTAYRKVIGLKWIYKLKRNANGEIIKYKTRLVSKRYVQEQGVDFDEIFAPVTRLKTVRFLLVLNEFKQQMNDWFEMNDWGRLSYYLGMEVQQMKDCIELKQSAYTKKILEKAGMQAFNPNKYPMDPNEHLTKDEGGKLVDPTEYKSLVGGLRYLVHTCLDMAMLWG
ncbi:putative mitochondrial protein AtMg00820 [Apium graveolens]|uniref:putative mitochondrial protein AtMg00820 n=1 Tax=Apium graveolens TaxID=4045 RepID=UPI003D7B60F9